MWKHKENNVYMFTEEENNNDSNYELVAKPSNEWREELYRQSLIANSGNQVTSANNYDLELLAEWRNIYDTITWEDSNGWNPNIINNLENLKYWLDIIDESSSIVGQYSISNIGKRTKVINDENINLLFYPTIPDVIFIENPENQSQIEELIKKYNLSGQKFCFYTKDQANLFTISSLGTTAYDKIKDLVFQYLTYNTQISISALPHFYLEPNNLIYVEDKKSMIKGNYVINQISLPLGYNSTMSISAIEAPQKL